MDMPPQDHDTLPFQAPRVLYDDTALRWVRRAPTSLSDFTGRPPTLALCEPVRGRRILDLGCGEGYCARLLKRAGAREVLGIDVSAQMIEAARMEEAREPLGIEYAVGNGTDLGDQPRASFDVVLAMFLFNYLNLADTKRCMARVASLLAPGGKFVFAVPHPMFPLVCEKTPPFYFDMTDAGYFEGRDGRFPGRIWRLDGGCLEVQLCHKTFEDYFNALAYAGFTTMPTVRELRVTPEILARDPEFFGPLVERPLHLAVSVMR